MHEGNEVKPGSAGRRTGFMDFAFGDQRLAVGSRPAGRRWQVTGNNYLFAGETRTVPGSPSRPSSRTFLTEILHCIVEYPAIMRDPATLDIEYWTVLLDIGYSPALRDPAWRDGILDIEIGCGYAALCLSWLTW